jgi:sporulation protein YlmC with PRC-barrel domain
MKSKVMFAVAALISMPLIASAQTEKPSQTGKPAQSDKPTQTGKTTPAPKPTETTPKMSMGTGPYVHTAAELVGMDVKNPQGENLGKIDDVVFYSNGQVAYAVLSFGGVLGMGDKLFAIPWSCLETAGRTDRTMRDDHVVLSVDKERLKSAPGFDKSNWPKLADVAWCADVDKYYANEKRGHAMEASAPTASTLTFRASQLKGKNVETPTGEKLGDIKEVVLDPTNARVSYVVLSVGGFLGVGDKLVAVPWEALKTTKDGDKEKLSLSITKEKLGQAPEFSGDAAHWPQMSDPAYIRKVYDFYSVRPYWSDSTAPGAAHEPTKKSDE